MICDTRDGSFNFRSRALGKAKTQQQQNTACKIRASLCRYATCAMQTQQQIIFLSHDFKQLLLQLVNKVLLFSFQVPLKLHFLLS